jgi:hypothetical protein
MQPPLRAVVVAKGRRLRAAAGDVVDIEAPAREKGDLDFRDEMALPFIANPFTDDRCLRSFPANGLLMRHRKRVCDCWRAK